MRVDQNVVAVVTGGATGMGRELCIQLSAKGCRVATCDIDQTNLDETVRLCKKAYDASKADAPFAMIAACPVDVSVLSDVRAFKETVKQAYGGELHMLFNNAGVSADGAMVETPGASEEEIAAHERAWDRCFNIDVWGVVYNLRAFLPMIVDTCKDDRAAGYVLNTSSINSFYTWPEHSSYSAAKGAVAMLTESLVIEMKLKHPNIRVANIMPGAIATKIASKSMTNYTKASNQDKGDVVKLFDAVAENSNTAAEAAEWILGAVAQDKQRILVGYDAIMIDLMKRIAPTYTYAMYDAMANIGVSGASPGDLKGFAGKLANPINAARFYFGGAWYPMLMLFPTLFAGLRRSNVAKGIFVGSVLFGVSKL